MGNERAVAVSDGYLLVNYYGMAKLLLAVMLTFAFVGIAPFAVENVQLDLSESGFSSGIRQIVFLSIWGLSLICFIKAGNKNDLSKFPVLLMLLAWCILSIIWATEPLISLRRVGLLVINISTVLMLVSVLDKDEVISAVSTLFAMLLVVSILSLAVFPGAVHQNRELFESGLTGAWKGVYIHKNQAGPAVAVSIFLFAYQYLRTRSLLWLLLIPLGLVFVFYTQSKTTMALVGPSMLFGLVMVWAVKRPVISNLIALAVFLAICFMLIFSEVLLEGMNLVIRDPEALTGRATIWNLIYQALQDHFWLGLGYGSVWRIGDAMVLPQYASGWVDWVFTLTHSHNGYLEAFISLGVIGFFLTLFVFIISPFYSVLFSEHQDRKFIFLFYSVFFFFVFHNLLETDLLNAADGRWLIFLVIYFVQKTKLTQSRQKTKVWG